MLCMLLFECDFKVGRNLTVGLLIAGFPATLRNCMFFLDWSSSLAHNLIHGFYLGAGHWWTSR